ncbi:hypothetical protein O6H91_02G084500 [Diphasiastrum complanatum]|uniref:Uncharacterized protein n=1 Tax=Diphasiastrum complanatum TaxID=34168 RepID=A0ACC2EHH3_DIPCM|nr:hypothetical protein O6H91_Y421200 [Diphasiastrum complanatum]KAJ7566008.1 hypothetical protein O6H91_02G084500 [Diphasiastrum complanatum]
MPEKDTINGPIKTVVVLVMENRSFDHMLGWLKRINPEVDGLTGTESNPLSTTNPNSPQILVSDSATYVDPFDPGHSFQAIRKQIFGSDNTSADPPPMNGFAQEAEEESKGLSTAVMRAFKPELLPVYTTLAMEFAVFDRWFASIPTSTQPNRSYVHSATSHGLMSNVLSDLFKGFPQKTIFDSLDDSQLSFGIYYQILPSTLFYDTLRQLKYINKFRDYYLLFKKDANEGKLPNYTVIEPVYYDSSILPANDDHPVHNVSNGQMLVKEVYETLRKSPQWNETLLIITYDEHGGFYDHVPTPVRNVPNPDGLNGPAPYDFQFDRLGVRVPTIMVSPWINKGMVVHEPNGPTPDSQYEHSSIPATVKKIFNLKADFLTKRDAWAGTFESIISARTTPRTDCPEVLPSPPASKSKSSSSIFTKLLTCCTSSGQVKKDITPQALSPHLEQKSINLSEFQEELVQLCRSLYSPDKVPHLNMETIGVEEAKNFVVSTFSNYIKSGVLALEAGEDETQHWHCR